MSPQSRKSAVSGSGRGRERKLSAEEVSDLLLTGEALPPLERLDGYEAKQGARRAKTFLKKELKPATGSGRIELQQRLVRVQTILQMFESFRW